MSAVHAAPGVAGLAPVAGQLAPIVDGGAVLGEDVGGVGDTAGFDQFQGDLPAVLLAVDRDDGFRGAPGQLLELFDRAADRSLGGQHLLALAAPGALTAVPRVVLIGVVILLLLGSLVLGRLALGCLLLGCLLLGSLVLSSLVLGVLGLCHVTLPRPWWNAAAARRVLARPRPRPARRWSPRAVPRRSDPAADGSRPGRRARARPRPAPARQSRRCRAGVPAAG